jgi:hypothetical protein
MFLFVVFDKFKFLTCHAITSFFCVAKFRESSYKVPFVGNFYFDISLWQSVAACIVLYHSIRAVLYSFISNLNKF